MTRRHDHYPECGVSAGLVCRDPDNTPAVETCPGRPLLPLHDSVERTKTSNHHGVAKSKAQLNRHKKGLELPVHVPCSWCGTSTKLLGGAVNTGSTYCPGDDCQRAKVRLKSRARAAKAKASRVDSDVGAA